MIRPGMFGLGFALPGDPPAALTLGDLVLWAVFCGDLDRAEKLIADSEAANENDSEAVAEAADQATASNRAPAEGNRSRPLAFPYRYAWNRMGRKGQRCAVLVRGKMNSCMLEFEDGFQAVTSRNALRKAKP